MIAQTGADGVTQRMFLDDDGLRDQQRIPYTVGLLGSAFIDFTIFRTLLFILLCKPLIRDGTVWGFLGEELHVARSDAKHRTRETMQGIVGVL